MGGVVVSNIGIIKYNLLIAAVAWALGAGASNLGLLALIAGCLVAVAVVARVRNPPVNKTVEGSNAMSESYGELASADAAERGLRERHR
jgi:hypothetical protein